MVLVRMTDTKGTIMSNRKFIALKRKSSSDDTVFEEIIINSDYIISMSPLYEGGTRIVMTDNEVRVQQLVTEILARMQ